MQCNNKVTFKHNTYLYRSLLDSEKKIVRQQILSNLLKHYLFEHRFLVMHSFLSRLLKKFYFSNFSLHSQKFFFHSQDLIFIKLTHAKAD